MPSASGSEATYKRSVGLFVGARILTPAVSIRRRIPQGHSEDPRYEVHEPIPSTTSQRFSPAPKTPVGLPAERSSFEFPTFASEPNWNSSSSDIPSSNRRGTKG